ncbi:hypothetical protein LV779_24515 [Streptomyces thinghirensis]|nr:hypothetical protein [Streptomyces thinghirensis]
MDRHAARGVAARGHRRVGDQPPMLSRPMSTDDRPPWDVAGPRPGGPPHPGLPNRPHLPGRHGRRLHRPRSPRRPPRGRTGPTASRPGPPHTASRTPWARWWPPSARATPKPAFDGEPTGRVDVCHADTPLARLRAIARAHGGTVTDVYLATLSHAVRTWYLKDTGSAHPPLPVSIPMSVRAPGEEYAPGNRMVTARLLLPCDEESPQRALARVVVRTGRLRESRRRATPCACCCPPPRGRSVPPSAPAWSAGRSWPAR